jgi:hypothetical protein
VNLNIGYQEGLGLMRRKQSIILPQGNELVKDFVIWLTIDYDCVLRGIQHNYHTIWQVWKQFQGLFKIPTFDVNLSSHASNSGVIFSEI